MRYGVSIPPFGDFFDVRVLARLAAEAEEAGWDGFFIWDHLLFGPLPIADPWVALTAIALATQRIRIGPMVTPLPRRRPHKLVREIVSIDHLSGGRLVLGVGIGALPFEWDYLGEESSPSVRGEMLDEGLEVLAALMTGRPLLHRGTHYTIDGELPGETRGAQFLPASLQSPRVPIWVAATWPKKRPFRRSAKWDGVVAMKAEGALSVEDVAEIRSYVGTNRKESEPFDFALSGTTARDDVDKLRAYERAGATWWLESIDPWRFGWNGTGIWPTSEMRRRVLDGPPRA